MKRSEMVEKLSEFLFYKDNDKSLEINLKQADEILDYLENMGMEPPECLCKNQYEDGYELFINNWEDE